MAFPLLHSAKKTGHEPGANPLREKVWCLEVHAHTGTIGAHGIAAVQDSCRAIVEWCVAKVVDAVGTVVDLADDTVNLGALA